MKVTETSQKKSIYINWNAVLKFLFPTPSVILLVIFNIIIVGSIQDSFPLFLIIWLVSIIIVFGMVIVPFDFIWFWIWGKRKISFPIQILTEQQDINFNKNPVNEIEDQENQNSIGESSKNENLKSQEVVTEFEKSAMKEQEKLFVLKKSEEAVLEKQKRDRLIAEKKAILEEKKRLMEQEEQKYQEYLKTKKKEREIIKDIVGDICADNFHSKPSDFNSEHFDSLEGHDFEYFCANLLSKNGFNNVEVTQGSGDQGIDIIAYKDDIKYGIQCKCYSSDIGNKAVQEAFAGKTFYNCHLACVLTNRYFTSSAKELAEKNGVLLWDRDKLLDLIKD